LFLLVCPERGLVWIIFFSMIFFASFIRYITFFVRHFIDIPLE